MGFEIFEWKADKYAVFSANEIFKNFAKYNLNF